MRRPTQMEAFDALYYLAAGDRRGEALFGDSHELAHSAFERTLIGGSYPAAYLEFPLLGEPCLDLLSVYGQVESGARFAPGSGFGNQAMFDWFEGVCTLEETVSCGLEVDISTGETERAGAYFQQRKRDELVAPFLASVGEPERAEAYLAIQRSLPQGWPPSYVGLFPGRTGSPMRIGGYMDLAELKRCAQDPAHLGRCFQAVGFTAYDQAMLERCAEFMRLAPSVDFQFDILPDGQLGDTFGLSLSFNDTKPREARECMESGYGAQLMQRLQDWGLADDRWKLIANAAFARSVAYQHDDGSQGRFFLCIRFNYAKVKFRAGEPQPAKFYLMCKSGDLEE